MKHYFSLLLLFSLFSISTFCQKYSAGTSVEIQWGTTWYKGVIKEVKGNEFKIGYDGYGANWDEWVTTERLRPVSQTSVGKPGNGSATGAKSANMVDKPQSAPVVNAAGYKDTNGKLYFRTYMWTGMYGSNLEINWIHLGNAGSIVRDPKNGLDPINYAAELVNNAKNVGKYKIVNNKLHVTWSTGKTEQWSLESKNGDYSILNGGIVTRPKPMPANYRISGKYAGGTVLPNVSSIQTFNFSKDGTFTLNRSGAIHTSDVSGLSTDTNKGTYSISGNTLRLNFDNGQKQVANILIWDMGGGKKHLVINSTTYPQEG